MQICWRDSLCGLSFFFIVALFLWNVDFLVLIDVTGDMQPNSRPPERPSPPFFIQNVKQKESDNSGAKEKQSDNIMVI